MSIQRMHSPFQGFTMIELVMVIVIIGILSAAALPRFANLTGQAQIAANQGTAGALRSAVGIAHAAWIAAGASSSASTVTLDNTAVTVNANGWSDGGAGSTTTISAAQCVLALTNVLANPPQTLAASCTDTPCYLTTGSVSANSTCTYSLYGGNPGVAVSGRTITYNISTGAIAAT